MDYIKRCVNELMNELDSNGKILVDYRSIKYCNNEYIISEIGDPNGDDKECLYQTQNKDEIRRYLINHLIN